ncbi:MAG: hypothetical protein RI911_140, partial [Candidatus Parcubacteria bacterium]
ELVKLGVVDVAQEGHADDILMIGKQQQ